MRRVFPGWSICIPRSFQEIFQEEDAYWHAWDGRRSVSLTSFLMVDENGPVERDALASALTADQPGASEDLPSGLVGWAADGPAVQPARARRALTAMLAHDGRVLLVTITHDDIAWARTVLHSIQCHQVPLDGEVDEAEAARAH